MLRIEHAAALQFFDHGNVIDCDLADEQGVEPAALGQIGDDALQPAQVDGILHETAAAMNPSGDLESRPRRKAAGGRRST